MKYHVNSVTLIGSLIADPKYIAMRNGKELLNLRLATDKGYKDKNNEWQKITTFTNVTFFFDVENIKKKGIAKGDIVYIDGSLESSTYEKDGVKHYEMKVNGQTLIPVSSKKGAEAYKPEPVPSSILSDDSTPTEESNDVPF